MARHIGRHLEQQERIHHLNGNKSDNRIENLMLTENTSEHARIEIRVYLELKRELDRANKTISNLRQKLLEK